MNFGVLIVGLGQIGMGYDLNLDASSHVYSHCRAFDLHNSFNVLGAVDPDKLNRTTFENEFQCLAYKNVEDALKNMRPELVVIAAPTVHHSKILNKVIELANPKAILCEKPLAYDIEDARSMIENCKENGIQLFVNYMRRADPAVIEIKQSLESGVIKGPAKGVAWYSKGLMHNGSHLFNLIEYWLGEMVGFKVISPGKLLENGDRESDVKVYFENGEILFLSLQDESYSHYTIELMMTNGLLRYERAGHHVTWQQAIEDTVFKGNCTISNETQIIASSMNKFQYNVASQLALAFGEKEHFLSEGGDALRTLESLSEILEKT